MVIPCYIVDFRAIRHQRGQCPSSWALPGTQLTGILAGRVVTSLVALSPERTPGSPGFKRRFPLRRHLDHQMARRRLRLIARQLLLLLVLASRAWQ